MFRFKNKRNESSDATAMYDVLLDKKYTVREFIVEVLEIHTKDWGYIGIKAENNIFFGNPRIEYRYGKLIQGTDLSDFPLNSTIKSIFAAGGWSRMDYVIELEETVK